MLLIVWHVTIAAGHLAQSLLRRTEEPSLSFLCNRLTIDASLWNLFRVPLTAYESVTSYNFITAIYIYIYMELALVFQMYFCNLGFEFEHKRNILLSMPFYIFLVVKQSRLEYSYCFLNFNCITNHTQENHN